MRGVPRPAASPCWNTADLAGDTRISWTGVEWSDVSVRCVAKWRVFVAFCCAFAQCEARGVLVNRITIRAFKTRRGRRASVLCAHGVRVPGLPSFRGKPPGLEIFDLRLSLRNALSTEAELPWRLPYTLLVPVKVLFCCLCCGSTSDLDSLPGQCRSSTASLSPVLGGPGPTC